MTNDQNSDTEALHNETVSFISLISLTITDIQNLHKD